MTPQNFAALKSKSFQFRQMQSEDRVLLLKKMDSWIRANEEAIYKALESDFNKPRFETAISEIFPCLSELKFTISNLKKWMRPKTVSTPLALAGHKSTIRYENKGVVLIISPWNYPFQLAVVPLISALAAGNTAVIKPSELTPATSDLIAKMVHECFTTDEVTVELGGKEKTEELLKYRFDHVFFTGSTVVGRIVAKACAEQLIPVTLELGGKSPTIIDQTADLDEAADKIFWGKYLNRAQTCVAPDYLLIHQEIASELVKKIKVLAEQHDQQDKGHIINSLHHKRLQSLTDTTTDYNQKTLEIFEVKNVDHPAMKEEIFGPVLPFITFKSAQDISPIINSFEKPLSFYVFSKDRAFIEDLLTKFPSGGAGINSVLLQFGNHHLPFGGIGHSGSGEYHGHYGFLQMSHARAVIESRHMSFLRRLLMPPYTPFKMQLLEVLKRF